MAKWNSKRWNWIEVVGRVASHKDELSLREEPEVKSALTSPALQKYCHLKYFEWPMFVSKAAQTLFGHQSYWLCETWSCEPLALSQEVRCHFACVKQTYWVLTGAESLSTVVAEPNWTQLFFYQRFWWHNHLLNVHPCIWPQLLYSHSKSCPILGKLPRACSAK